MLCQRHKRNIKISVESVSVCLGIYHTNDTFYCDSKINDELTSLEIVKNFVAENKLFGYKTFKHRKIEIVGYFVDGVIDGFVIKYFKRRYRVLGEELYHNGILIRGKNMEDKQTSYYDENIIVCENAITLNAFINRNESIISSYSLTNDGAYNTERIVVHGATLAEAGYDFVWTNTHNRYIYDDGGIMHNNIMKKITYKINGDIIITNIVGDINEDI